MEGCYIPFDWEKDFEAEYLANIKYICLVMSEHYIKNHFADIRHYASVIEDRGEDEDCTIESVLEDNARTLELCHAYQVKYCLIEDEYEVEFEW